MNKSKHNIFSQLRDSDQFFIVNPLWGSADILSPEEALEYQSGQFTDEKLWAERGYIVNQEEEEKEYKKQYLDFIDRRDTEEIQLFFVPTYACNFACSYCYQIEYAPGPEPLKKEVVDAFFDYIASRFSGREKYITLFGGEPLLPGEKNREMTRYLVEKSIQHKIDLAIVTNGYLLEEYLPVFEGAKIREIQVTLDGTQEFHDARRMLRNKQGTFEQIVRGIDAAIGKGYMINLRMVIDKDNLPDLPDFAQFAIDRGWTQSHLFKTQLGRNYELHTCQTEQNRLYSRIELYQDLYQMLQQHPHIIDFYKPGFSIAKFLFENSELPAAIFDACPGTKSEWAFDYTGSIYSCTATVGKQEEKLGTFFPQVYHNEDLIADWEERDVLAIDECKGCSLQLICGGGCASLAKNQSNGDLYATDCRPVKELLELGMSFYRQNY